MGYQRLVPVCDDKEKAHAEGGEAEAEGGEMVLHGRPKRSLLSKPPLKLI